MRGKNLVLSLAALIAVGILSACGGGGGSSSGVSMVESSGKVALGDVAGARVFADYDGDEEWDLDEPFTFTDEEGNFTFSFKKGDYNLVTSGGIDMLTGAPAGTLKAPSGASNITYLTTMVVEVPGFKEALEQIAPGVPYDSDVTEAIDADFIKITKIVESTVKTFENLGVNDQNALLDVVATVAEKIVENVPESGIEDVNTLLCDAVQQAAENIVTDLSANTDDSIELDVDPEDVVALGTAISSIADGVITAIEDNTGEDGTIIEEEVQGAIDTVDSTVDDSLVKTVTIKVSGLNVGGTDYAPAEFDTITVAEDENTVAVTLAATNDFIEAKVYSNVAVTLSVVGENGRKAYFDVKGLSVTVAAASTEGADESVVLTMDDSGAVLEFEAENASGDISITLKEAIVSPIDGLSFDGNIATFDLAAIEGALAAKVGTAVIDIADISTLGNYSLVVTVKNAPAQAVAATVEVIAAP